MGSRVGTHYKQKTTRQKYQLLLKLKLKIIFFKVKWPEPREFQNQPREIHLTGTFICTFYCKMYNSVHAFGIDKIPGLRETPYLGSVNNNYVWIISLFKLINDTTNEYK